MLEQMIAFFLSWFTNPSLIGIGLALIFGAVWLAIYPWLWAVMAGSALLALLAVTFIQIPLQIWTGDGFHYYWSQETLLRWFFVVSILPILYSGLVQEGAKLVPIVIYWWRKGKSIDPRLGLAIGAIAGAVGAQLHLCRRLELADGADRGYSGAGSILGEILCRCLPHRRQRARWLGFGQRLGVAVLPAVIFPACLPELQRCFPAGRSYHNSANGNICRGLGCPGKRRRPLAALEERNPDGDSAGRS